MYRFSRSIYREIASSVIEDERDSTDCRNKQLVLDECEETIRRLAYDRRYFARPPRTLFNAVRPYFSMGDLPRVYFVIERNIAVASDFLRRMPDYAFAATGLERSCQAMTRKGKPCQRQPLSASEYCPSHQHLEERFEELELDELELAA